MTRTQISSLPADHPVLPAPRTGVILVNLGTPDAPTAAAVRRYLAEFLSDRRVVELPASLWQPILRGVILPFRPRRSAAAYASIWTSEGSPLAAITARQAAALGAALGERVTVMHAMRYGQPAIGRVIAGLVSSGCRRLVVAPLYPQYCAATSAAAADAVYAAIGTMRWQPSVRVMSPYFEEAAYIDAIADSVRKALASLDFEPDTLVASFHGMPRRTLALGDPYHCHCRKTARLVSEALARPVEVAFQSRFGRAKWLEPATDATLARLGRSRKTVAVFAPGFAADCLETLEELAMRGKEEFLAAGGSRFAYLPCLNDGPEGMALIEALVRRELQGWI